MKKTSLKNKPPYYRPEFEQWRGRHYDFLFGLSLLGSQKRIRRLIFDFFPANPQKILDLACGTGSETILIKEKYQGAEVFGVDLSTTMLAKAREKAQKKKMAINFSRQNIEKTNFPDEFFDLVTVAFGLHEVPPVARKNTLAEIFRVLRKSGSLVILELNYPRNQILRLGFEIFLKINEPQGKTFLAENLRKTLSGEGFKKIVARFSKSRLVQILRSEK